MQQPGHASSRKKFLQWGSAVLASLAILNVFKRRSVKKEPPVKMLTEDGRLVEVSKKMLADSRKITDKELQQWIKK